MCIYMYKNNISISVEGTLSEIYLKGGGIVRALVPENFFWGL